MEGSPLVLHFSFQCLVTSTFLDTGGSLAQLRKIWDPLMEPIICTECDQATHPIHLLIDHCQVISTASPQISLHVFFLLLDSETEKDAAV